MVNPLSLKTYDVPPVVFVCPVDVPEVLPVGSPVPTLVVVVVDVVVVVVVALEDDESDPPFSIERTAT